jgi:hypothetical protein
MESESRFKQPIERTSCSRTSQAQPHRPWVGVLPGTGQWRNGAMFCLLLTGHKFRVCDCISRLRRAPQRGTSHFYRDRKTARLQSNIAAHVRRGRLYDLYFL